MRPVQLLIAGVRIIVLQNFCGQEVEFSPVGRSHSPSVRAMSKQLRSSRASIRSLSPS